METRLLLHFCGFSKMDHTLAREEHLLVFLSHYFFMKNRILVQYPLPGKQESKSLNFQRNIGQRQFQFRQMRQFQFLWKIGSFENGEIVPQMKKRNIFGTMLSKEVCCWSHSTQKQHLPPMLGLVSKLIFRKSVKFPVSVIVIYNRLECAVVL